MSNTLRWQMDPHRSMGGLQLLSIARARKEAIWSRGTGSSGQYDSGSVEHPLVMPAARIPSASAAC